VSSDAPNAAARQVRELLLLPPPLLLVLLCVGNLMTKLLLIN